MWSSELLSDLVCVPSLDAFPRSSADQGRLRVLGRRAYRDDGALEYRVYRHYRVYRVCRFSRYRVD